MEVYSYTCNLCVSYGSLALRHLFPLIFHSHWERGYRYDIYYQLFHLCEGEEGEVTKREDVQTGTVS